MNGFLNERIYINLRDSLNETEIFIQDEELKEHYNLFSVVIDRLESSVTYLNKHSEQPETEDDFLFFIMYSCIVLDAVKHLLNTLKIKNDYRDSKNINSYTYFKDVCLGYPLNLTEEECPTDDKFFEYFRSLTMAHPFETSRPIFFEKGEIQYSPWVINDSRLSMIEDAVGTRIYSNQYDEIKDLIFSFSLLKEYIKSRYLQINLVIKNIHQIINKKRKEWQENKITRGLSAVETLKEIKERLEDRHEDTYPIDLILKTLEIQLTDPKNHGIVAEYREAVRDLIPNLIVAVEELNHERLFNLMDNVLFARPKHLHKGAHYQLEKIFSYLNNGQEDLSNYKWGLQKARAFAEEIGSKWITIHLKKMTGDEIKLLIRVACYFEKREQSKEF